MEDTETVWSTRYICTDDKENLQWIQMQSNLQTISCPLNLKILQGSDKVVVVVSVTVFSGVELGVAVKEWDTMEEPI